MVVQGDVFFPSMDGNMAVVRMILVVEASVQRELTKLIKLIHRVNEDLFRLQRHLVCDAKRVSRMHELVLVAGRVPNETDVVVEGCRVKKAHSRVLLVDYGLWNGVSRGATLLVHPKGTHH